MKNRLVTTLVFILLFFSLVSAEVIEIKSPNIFDKINKYFIENSFTIVGQDNHASVYPDETWYLNANGILIKTLSETNDLCFGNSGFYNVFAQQGTTWYNRFETIDSIATQCGSSNTQCRIELYCMPYDYPPTDFSCALWEAGSVSKTKTATDQLMPLVDSNGEDVNSYTYCTEGCTDAPIKCWQVNGQECISREYSCGYETYNNCPTSWPFKGNTASESGCQAAIPTSCTPNCNGKCGGVSDGCTGTCNSVCGTTSTCSDGIKNQDETGIDCGGLCSACSQTPTLPEEDDPSINTIISNVQISKTQVSPGDQLQVTFDVKATDNEAREYYIEAGIIPSNVASDWNITQESGTFSIIDWFKGDVIENECCDGQPNIQGGTYVFNSAFEEGQKTIRITLNAPNSNTVDLCPLNGGTDYWDETDQEYVVYITVKNGCYKDGYRVGIYEARDILIGVNTTSTGRGEGEECENDYECASGICESAGFLPGKECKGISEANGGTGSGGNSLIDAKKLALTKDQISSATSQDLLASACLSSNECITNSSDYVSCKTIASLRSEGVLSEEDSNNFFTNAKTITKGTVYGATAGVATCLIASTTSGIFSGGTLIVPVAVGCASIGALFGGTATMAYLDISDQDNLIKELDADNENAVGICTRETSFDLGGWIESLGEKINITGNKTTDGFIVLIGGAFLLFFILSMLGGRK